MAASSTKLFHCWKAFYDWSSSLLHKMTKSPQEGSTAQQPANPVVYRIGPCGGSGGEARATTATPTTRILKVMVGHGSAIDAIRVMYRRDDDGPAESTEWWGIGGENQSEFSLGKEERLTCVSGHYGEYGGDVMIRSLKFTTAGGVSYGPYGTEEGTSFNLDAQGGRIVGCFGLSGGYLYAIGIYTAAN